MAANRNQMPTTTVASRQIETAEGYGASEISASGRFAAILSSPEASCWRLAGEACVAENATWRNKRRR